MLKGEETPLNSVPVACAEILAEYVGIKKTRLLCRRESLMSL